MADFPIGTQARVVHFEAEPELSGRACVSLGAALGEGKATVRLSSGRDLDIATDNLEKVAVPGRLPVGIRVLLVGLSKAPEMNGRAGTVAEFCPSISQPSDRILVNLGPGTAKALRFENVVLVDPAHVARGAGLQLPKASQANNAIPLPASTPKAFAPPTTAPKALGPLRRAVRLSVKEHVDPGLNGMEGIVLDSDPFDSARWLVMLPALGRVLSLTPKNMTHKGNEASAFEMTEMRPPLQEAFYTELRKLLWAMPHERESLSVVITAARNKDNPWSPPARTLSAWMAFLSACAGVQTMQTVLQQRPDLFLLSKDSSGHDLVSLCAGGKQLNTAEGVPEPPSKKRRAAQDSSCQKKDELSRTLFTAMKLCAGDMKGRPVSVSTLCSDVKVKLLRNDPDFAKLKIVQVLREYPNVFKVDPEPPPGTSFHVRLLDGAEMALPQRKAGESAPEGSGDVLPDPEELNLPDKLETTASLSERMQALRIELIHALQRREGEAEPQSLGMEPGVSKIRREMGKAKSLIEMIRVFDTNFSISLGSDNRTFVKLLSKDVDDMSPIDEFMRRHDPRRREPRPNGSSRSSGAPGRPPGPGYMPPGTCLAHPNIVPVGYPCGYPGFGYAPPAGYLGQAPPPGYSTGYPPPGYPVAPGHMPHGYHGGFPPMPNSGLLYQPSQPALLPQHAYSGAPQQTCPAPLTYPVSHCGGYANSGQGASQFGYHPSGATPALYPSHGSDNYGYIGDRCPPPSHSSVPSEGCRPPGANGVFQ